MFQASGVVIVQGDSRVGILAGTAFVLLGHRNPEEVAVVFAVDNVRPEEIVLYIMKERMDTDGWFLTFGIFGQQAKLGTVDEEVSDALFGYQVQDVFAVLVSKSAQIAF